MHRITELRARIQSLTLLGVLLIVLGGLAIGTLFSHTFDLYVAYLNAQLTVRQFLGGSVALQYAIAGTAVAGVVSYVALRRHPSYRS